jgi:CRP/FNR family transcriptional regulator, cyclic AMP receptor protein
MATPQEIFERYGKVFKAGTRIFQEGDPGEEMFIIQSGQVKITKKTQDGEKTLVILSEGDFFGEMAVIDNEPRSASAVAQTDTKLIALNQAVFEATMQSNAHIVKKILRNMSSRLRETNKQLAILMLKDHNRRVANTLLQLCQKHGRQTPQGFSMDITLAVPELANMVGLSDDPAKVRDILLKMEKNKILQLSGNAIQVLSIESLDKFIKFLEMKEEFEL